MATYTEITPQELEMIEKQAEEKYPWYKQNVSYDKHRMEGYIAAKTESAIEIKKLREGLLTIETLCENWFLGNDANRIYRLIRETINESLKQ